MPLLSNILKFSIPLGLGIFLIWFFVKDLTAEDKEKIAEVILFDASDETAKKIKTGITIAKIICEGTILARDLENAPSNEIYPETLAAAAQSSAKEFGFECEVWDKVKIEEEKFGGLLAVSSGSVKEPRFIILKYNGTQSAETQPMIFPGAGRPWPESVPALSSRSPAEVLSPGASVNPVLQDMRRAKHQDFARIDRHFFARFRVASDATALAAHEETAE